MDKKKKLALGGLGIILLAIGGFQFVGGGSEPPVPPKADKAKVVAKAAETKGPAAASETSTEPESEADTEGALVAAAALPARDPFDGSMYQPKEQEIKPTPPNPDNQTRPKAQRGAISGKLPPFDPSMGALPNPSTGGVTLEPGKLMADPNAFGYGVSGVITGAQPAAVFTDASGAQRLICEGGAIDGDSRVISISRGKVVVRHKNKTLTLSVGGSTNEK